MKRTARLDIDRTRFTPVCIAAAIALAAAALAGCASSPPTQFYSLSAVSAQSASPRSSAGISQREPVRVAAVHVPPRLDRREIVRTGPGDRLDVSGIRRWGAPLDEMVQHTLTRDLVERLPSGTILLPSGPAPAGARAIVVDLLQFQSDTGGAVVLQGSWSLLPAGKDDPTLIRDFKYEASASATDYSGEATAMSELLGRLADDIASEVRARH